MTDTWFDWGYLLGTLLQIALVALVVCLLGLMINSAIYTIIQRWTNKEEDKNEDA
jgi:hypothetical protein